MAKSAVPSLADRLRASQVAKQAQLQRAQAAAANPEAAKRWEARQAIVAARNLRIATRRIEAQARKEREAAERAAAEAEALRVEQEARAAEELEGSPSLVGRCVPSYRYFMAEQDPIRAVHLTELIGVRVNREYDRLAPRQFLRVFRNKLGDWCAEAVVEQQQRVLVFDYHPTISVLGVLRSSSVDIADQVLSQGAEGLDMRQHARRVD